MLFPPSLTFTFSSLDKCSGCENRDAHPQRNYRQHGYLKEFLELQFLTGCLNVFYGDTVFRNQTHEHTVFYYNPTTSPSNLWKFHLCGKLHGCGVSEKATELGFRKSALLTFISPPLSYWLEVTFFLLHLLLAALELIAALELYSWDFLFKKQTNWWAFSMNRVPRDAGMFKTWFIMVNYWCLGYLQGPYRNFQLGFSRYIWRENCVYRDQGVMTGIH